MNLHQAVAKLWLALPTFTNPKTEEAARAAVVALGVNPDAKRLGDTMKAIADGDLERPDAAPFYVFRAPPGMTGRDLDDISRGVEALRTPAAVVPNGFAVDPVDLPHLILLREFIDGVIAAGRPTDPEAEPRSITEDGETLADGLVRAADLAEHYRARATDLEAELDRLRPLALRVVACDLESTEAAIDALSGLFTDEEIADAAEQLAAESEPPTEPFPVFPDIGCRCDPPECGFVSAGLGYQCLEGAACRRYVHPGDPHFAEIRDYDRKMTELSKRR